MSAIKWISIAGLLACAAYFLGRADGEFVHRRDLYACRHELTNRPISPTVVLPHDQSRIRIVCHNTEGCSGVYLQSAGPDEEFKTVDVYSQADQATVR